MTPVAPYRVPALLGFGAIVVLLGGGGFAATESRTVSTYWEGVWWALSLMTTVGFVGEAPETVIGRALSAALMVSGFALMTLTTAAIASLFVREEEAPEKVEERAFEDRVLHHLDDLDARLDRIEQRLAPPPPPPPAAGTREADPAPPAR